MDVIYAGAPATAAEVRAALPDPPSYSTVRALLRILETKGHLTHESVQGRYVFTPRHARAQAGRGALRHLLRTFFDNSAAKAVAALLDVSDAELSDAEFKTLQRIIETAEQRGTE